MVKKEIIYRLTRIFLSVLILITLTLVREETIQNYQEIEKSDLLNRLQVTKLMNKKEQKEVTSTRNGYKVKIKNPNKKDRKIIFKLENVNNEANTKYVKYTILKENQNIVTGNIENNKILYEDTLKENEEKTYEIIFWIEENIKSQTSNFTAKLKII